MAAIHEYSSTFARSLLRIARATAATSQPFARPVRQADFERCADLCARVLREARSVVGAGAFGPGLSDLLARASDLLDDIDEFLIAMDPLEDSEAYLCAADLHRVLEEIQARVPRQFRGRRYGAGRRAAPPSAGW